MSDLIDRQALIDAMAELQGRASTKAELKGISKIGKRIKQLPSAQPERKKGEWIPVTNGRGGHECDQCHSYAPAWQTGEERLTDYCPNCGADMGGEQDADG